MDIMGFITKIATVEMTATIWEYDPTLPSNRVLGNSLDVVAAIRMLAIKIQESGQHISYFEHLQTECGIEIPLVIPLHSNIHLGTADGMLGCSYHLRQPINLFVSSADELFGPITTLWCAGDPVKNIPWMAFMFKVSDWEHINDTHAIIAGANKIQHIFSHEHQATLWRAIPAFKELQTAWEAKVNTPKYYNKFDDKPIYVLALVLHPYYKLAYIKMAWGGSEEQQQEREAGNPNAKDWHDEEYWDATHADIDEHRTACTAHTSALGCKENDMLKSEFDHHCCELIKQNLPKDGGGWKAELRHYLGDLPTDVLKETDIVMWWGNMRWNTQPLPKLQKMSVLFLLPQYLVSDFFQLHAWHLHIKDLATVNSAEVNEVQLEEFKELLIRDAEMQEWDEEASIIAL
ncbi:hypothetical protein BU15DRAFT_72913 [Melanogaster broomeanus]|nr:hypothetical protein BU15DRAFT_72913 [Melanogaster broomeanus]